MTLALIVLTLLCCSQFSLATTGTPPVPPSAPPTPMPVPQVPSGGDCPMQEPATFQPYTLPLLANGVQ